jgi:protein-tyrosine-phosphatase
MAVTAVLFACNLNRVRSPMAAALARRIGGDRLYTDSCGLVAAEEIDGFAAAVMAELGLDLTEHAPKTFEAVRDRPFDLIVSLTPEAHRRAEEIARDRGIAAEYWPAADPTEEGGSREQRLTAYRAVRDELKRRLTERFGRPGRSG